MFKGAKPFRTLIDTGATTTMISANVVAEHGMRPVGKIPFGSNHGIVRRRAYLFHVAFLASPFQQPIQEDHDTALDPAAVRTLVYTKEIHGGELPADTTFDVLLGMDVISAGDLTFRRDGTFRFDL